MVNEEKPYRYTELADGTILNANAGFDGDSSVWIWMLDPDDPHNNMMQALLLFGDEEKTRQIKMHIGDRVDTYEGFTNLTAVQLETNGLVNIRLRKE